jgi:hypothetical protein
MALKFKEKEQKELEGIVLLFFNFQTHKTEYNK